MEINQLKYFLAVARTENLTQAALNLNLAQPALTKQIRNLETALGFLLFERLARGVKLTPAGQSLARDCENISRAMSDAVNRARLVSEGKSGHLKIGFVDTAIYSGEVADLITRYRAKFPHVVVELRPYSSVKQSQLLSIEELDIGFIYYAYDSPSNLSSIDLTQYEVMLAVPDHHALTNRKSVKLEQLAAEPFVWFPRRVSPAYFDTISNACKDAGFELNVVQEADDDFTMISLVLAGAGLTFTIEASKHRLPQQIKLVPVSGLDVRVTLRIAWNSSVNHPSRDQFLTFLSERRSH